MLWFQRVLKNPASWIPIWEWNKLMSTKSNHDHDVVKPDSITVIWDLYLFYFLRHPYNAKLCWNHNCSTEESTSTLWVFTMWQHFKILVIGTLVTRAGSPLTWKTEKPGEIFLMKKSGKFSMISQSQGKNEIVLANDIENVDITYFDSIFCQKNKSYQRYFLLKWWQIGVREKQFKSGLIKTWK